MKIGTFSVLTYASLFAVINANNDEGTADNLLRGSVNIDRNLVYVQKGFNNMRCQKPKAEIQVCFKADDWPHENTLRIQNQRGIEGFAMGPFEVEKKKHCEIVACCPGVYNLYVDDSYGDGVDRGYVSLGKRNIYNPAIFDTFKDVSLISASYYTFGPMTFTVEEEWAITTGATAVTHVSVSSSSPWGCAVCSCCMAKCEQRRAYQTDPNRAALIKQCQADLCYSHFGLGYCTSTTNGNTIIPTVSTFNPLSGCSTCRCCKDKCAAKYDIQVEKKACKDDFCRAHFGIDICRDHSNFNPTATTTPISTTTTTTIATSPFNPLSGCSNCRCCKDKCAAMYDDEDDKKDCKTNICRAHFGRDQCDSNNTGVAVTRTGTAFNPLDGCSNCRCCKDNCEDQYTGDERKDCKTNICRAFYGKEPCVDGNTSTGVTATGIVYDPFSCTNCRCCEDSCAEIYANDDEKKECKTLICREYHGRDACDD